MSDFSTMYLGVHTHVMGESGVGLPANRSSGRANFFHHPVNLLEGEAFGFPYHEVGVAELLAEFKMAFGKGGILTRHNRYRFHPK